MRLSAILAAILSLFAGMPAPGQEAASSPPTQPTLWVIPHTHWEGAVFKTREEYLDIGLTNISKALKLLKTYPEYRFALDQAAYVKPFLERYPEQAQAFREFVRQGRLQIVGGVDTMHDNNMPSGESIVRQFLLGKNYYREALGVDVTVGWALDTFGHNAQMPQLLKRAGFKSYWLRRGAPRRDLPTTFLWEALDGSKIPTFWLPHGYSLFYRAPANPIEFVSFAKLRFATLDAYTPGPNRVAFAGADVSDPDEHLPRMVAGFNNSQQPFKIRFAVPTEYEAMFNDLPTVKAEFNPVFQGIYSSRIEVKQWTRETERILTSAEKLVSMGKSVGAKSLPAPSEIERAWEPVLFNQAHDLASGVMVDKVYEDSMDGFRFAKRLGDEAVDTAMRRLGSQVDTSGGGAPVLVFNTLGWSRTDLVQAEFGFSESDLYDVALTDSHGSPVQIQFLQYERYGDGSLRSAKIAFIARDIPAMGYSLFRLRTKPLSDTGQPIPVYQDRLYDGTAAYQDTGVIENDYYRLTGHLWNGSIQSLIVKSTNWEVLSKPGNVVALEQDGGDFWELYGSLAGSRMLAMKGPHGVPAPDRARFSTEWVGGRFSHVKAGDVFSEFRVEHPFGKGSFSTQVRVYNGVRRIDFYTEIENNDELVRYRVLFPVSVANGKNVQEIPFGALERPLANEYPAQNWIDYGDGSKGVALLNRGLPGNNVADNTLLLSLMRSSKLLSYPFFGGFEPGVSSDSGLELGKKIGFHYALVPHQGDWTDAQTYRVGLEFNNPLLVQKEEPHEGSLPARWGLLLVSHPNVVVSALKPGPQESLILRVYEAAGKAAENVRIEFTPALAAVYESDLMESQGRELGVQNNAIEFSIGGFEIKTFRLKL